MDESQMIKAMNELTKEIRELREEITDLKSSLRPVPSTSKGLAVPPWLRFEALESLARAGKPVSTEEIAQSINERRGMDEERTSRASVSRAISELVEKEIVMQKKVGRRIFYGLTGKAQVLFSEGKTLEEAIKAMTKKVIDVEGRKCGAYMISVFTPEMRNDARSIADEILGDKHKKGEISVNSSTSYSKSEISLLLLP
jgi:predicted transcriptional regulator